jgi:hypothetical protein
MFQGNVQALYRVPVNREVRRLASQVAGPSESWKRGKELLGPVTGQ